MTCTETAKTIRLYQLELASKNREYEIEDVIQMHNIVKKYNLKKEEKEKLKKVESNYGYKQPQDSKGNIELTLQLTHKWGEYDFEKKLIEVQNSTTTPISLAVQVDSKDIKLTNEQKKKWSKEKAFFEIESQIKAQNLSNIWTLNNCIGKILTPRGNTPFDGWVIQNPIEFPDIAVLIWQQSVNDILKFNIYTLLLPNHLVKKDTKTITNEALCIKNQEDPSIDTFISSVISLAHQAIEKIFQDTTEVGY